MNKRIPSEVPKHLQLVFLGDCSEKRWKDFHDAKSDQFFDVIIHNPLEFLLSVPNHPVLVPSSSASRKWYSGSSRFHLPFTFPSMIDTTESPYWPGDFLVFGDAIYQPNTFIPPTKTLLDLHKECNAEKERLGSRGNGHRDPGEGKEMDLSFKRLAAQWTLVIKKMMDEDNNARKKLPAVEVYFDNGEDGVPGNRRFFSFLGRDKTFTMEELAQVEHPLSRHKPFLDELAKLGVAKVGFRTSCRCSKHCLGYSVLRKNWLAGVGCTGDREGVEQRQLEWGSLLAD